MKFPVFIIGAVCAGLSACAAPNEGNPDGDAYAGSPGSVYDVAANPPRTAGVTSYNPMAPLPPTASTTEMNGSAMLPAAPPASPVRR
jgi:hypothetical protein